MRTVIIISISLIILILIIIPFYLPTEQQDTIKASAALVSSVASLITLIIAFILFDKYGLKKDFVKNQTDLVLRQLEKIMAVRFLIRTNDRSLQFFPTKNRTDRYESFYSEKLVFSEKYWDYINDIFEPSTSIHMPKEIVEKIEKLQPSLIAYLEHDELSSYAIVTFGGENKIEYGKINDDDITFKEFYTYWIDVLDVMSNWLKDKIDISKLNIEL